MAMDQTRIVTFGDVVDYMGSHDRTKHDKGDLWERVCSWYLRNDPEMCQVVGAVWRWDDSDNPLRTGHDTGIDIVAERADVPGTYWAIQCKNYDPGHKLSLNDLGTFFAAAEADDRYTGLVIATFGEEVSSNVEEHLLALQRNRGVTSLKLTPSDMAKSNVDWSLLMQLRDEDPEARRARTFDPRPHQREAIDRIQASFELHDRAKAIMACGTGKTLTALRLAEARMAANGCRDVLFCAPSIALVAQSMREWTNQARVPFRSLVVCSDAKASRVGEDDLLDSVVDVGFPATTDSRALVERYRCVREQDPDALVVVFSTYQSMQVVQDAQAAGLPRFGLCVCDEAYVSSTGDASGPTCRLDHVDGSMDSKLRERKLGWLAGASEPGECRILTNARCLAEGVDVPSLDAVIFFSPKRSKVDVVQAVGRVMRTFHRGQPDEKRLGYIILPVAIPSEMTPEEALNQSDSFDVVWGVLQALRSHDQRIDAYINSLPMRKARKKGGSLGIGGKSGRADSDEAGVPRDGTSGAQTSIELDFGVTDLERAVYAKAVERCGSKVYWSSWAEDVGRIAQAHVEQIGRAVESDPVANKAMASFLASLRDSLNPGITQQAAIEMVAQHMVTLPVFDALFGDYAFAQTNPVSVAIEEFVDALRGHGIGDMSDDDRRSLDELYRSVRRRASFCRTDSNRQSLIKDLYNEFFSKASLGRARSLASSTRPCRSWTTCSTRLTAPCRGSSAAGSATRASTSSTRSPAPDPTWPSSSATPSSCLPTRSRTSTPTSCTPTKSCCSPTTSWS